jgi:hypothetical protein
LLFIIQNRFKADAKRARPLKTKGNPPWKILSTSEVPLKRSRCSLSTSFDQAQGYSAATDK